MKTIDPLDQIAGELRQAQDVLKEFRDDKSNLISINRAAELIAQSIDGGGKVLSCGNGGSHCDAMHFAEEMSGRFRNERSALPAIAIADSSHITCVANDQGFDQIFSRFIEGVGNEGDVLLALSTSGNSNNIIRAIETARIKGMKVVTLSGKDGGKMAGMEDVEIRVQHFGFADRIQEVHIKIIHSLILLIEQKLNLA